MKQTESWTRDRADDDTESDAGSGVCELTNQSRLGREGLKETGVHTVQYGETDVFFEH